MSVKQYLIYDLVDDTKSQLNFNEWLETLTEEDRDAYITAAKSVETKERVLKGRGILLEVGFSDTEDYPGHKFYEWVSQAELEANHLADEAHDAYIARYTEATGFELSYEAK